MHYDLLVIGNDTSGQQAAIAAARTNKRVAVVEQNRAGAAHGPLPAGAKPLSFLRDAVLQLSELRGCRTDAAAGQRQREATMVELRGRLMHLARQETDLLQEQLEQYGVESLFGEARFTGPHAVEVDGPDGKLSVTADEVLLACGTKPARPGYIAFDGERVLDTDEVLKISCIPASMVVVGGGETGLAYATAFAMLGVQVTVVDGRRRLLEFCDREIVDTLLDRARSVGVDFQLGADAIGVDYRPNQMLAIELETGRRLIAETALIAVGSIGNTERLNLPAAGIEPDERGRLWCDEDGRTWVPHIAAVGDCVGFPPALPAAQYRLATIPEFAQAGRTEEQLTADRVPFEVDLARFPEITPLANVAGRTGLLKALFHADTRELLGVHAVGEMAAEVIQIGQAVVAFGGTIDYFRQTVCNMPALADGYQPARCREFVTA